MPAPLQCLHPPLRLRPSWWPLTREVSSACSSEPTASSLDVELKVSLLLRHKRAMAGEEGIGDTANGQDFILTAVGPRFFISSSGCLPRREMRVDIDGARQH